MKQYLVLSPIFLSLIMVSALISMEKPAARPRSEIIAPEQLQAQYIQILKEEAKKAKHRDIIRSTYTTALRENSLHWLPILSYSIKEDKASRKIKKLRIFAELLLPKVAEIGDLFKVGSFIDVFTKEGAMKLSLKKDDTLYKILDRLEGRQQEIHKKETLSVAQLILNRRASIAEPDDATEMDKSEKNRVLRQFLQEIHYKTPNCAEKSPHRRYAQYRYLILKKRLLNRYRILS